METGSIQGSPAIPPNGSHPSHSRTLLPATSDHLLTSIDATYLCGWKRIVKESGRRRNNRSTSLRCKGYFT